MDRFGPRPCLPAAVRRWIRSDARTFGRTSPHDDRLDPRRWGGRGSDLTRQRPDAAGLRMLLALRQLRMIDLSILRLITPRAPVPCAS